MANKFLDETGLIYFWSKIVAKITGNIVNDLASTDATKSLSAAQGKVLDEKIKSINDGLGELGGGDMLKSQYDTDNNGKVDTAENAEKLGGQSPDYYAAASSLSNYVPTSQVGQASGVASLGIDGKVPTTQLPETAPIEHTHTMDEVDGLNEAAEALSVAFEEAVEDMTEIASGKCACYVFDTETALDSAIAEYLNYCKDGTEMSDNNVLKGQNLKTGDVFLIRAVNVPDYWWDGNQNKKQVLETTKVDLSAITTAEIDAIVGS